MPRTPISFSIQKQLSSTSSDIVAAAAANTQRHVTSMSFHNSGGSTRTVTVYRIPSGGTAGTTNILAVQTIPSGKTWICYPAINEILEVGQFIQAKQDAGTDINVNCSGSVIT